MSGFDPHAIEEAIKSAGNQLHQMWKRADTTVAMPENDLNPNAATIRFELKLLGDRVAELERQFGEILRHVKSR